MPTETTVTRELVCHLTEDELLERGDQMAAAELRAEQLKAERKRLNASIREQTDRRAELASVIENKRENRDVSCTWKPDYKTKQWRLHRSDTGDEVDVRDMTEGDLQARLFEGDASSADEEQGGEVIELDEKRPPKRKRDRSKERARAKAKKTAKAR